MAPKEGWPEPMKPGCVLRHGQERMLAAIRKQLPLMFAWNFPLWIKVTRRGVIKIIGAHPILRADASAGSATVPSRFVGLIRPGRESHLWRRQTFLRRRRFGFSRCFYAWSIEFQNPEARDRKHDDAPFRRVRCSASGHKYRSR